jgi:ankyrin repeat protein
LHIACLKGDLESYKLITEHGYECKNSIDDNGKTPMDLAYENKHTIIVDQDKKYTITLYSEKTKVANEDKISVKDFNFIMPLGQGAFGNVFLVEKDGIHYALKAMKKRTFNGLLNFIMTEKEVQRKIKHKFVVKLRYAF